MASEGLKAFEEFVKYVGQNEEATAKVKEISDDAQAIISYAKGLGYTFDEKDIQDYGKKVLPQTEELSDDDLEKVAGGKFIHSSAVAAAVGTVAGAAAGGAGGHAAGAAVGASVGTAVGPAVLV